MNWITWICSYVWLLCSVSYLSYHRSVVQFLLCVSSPIVQMYHRLFMHSALGRLLHIFVTMNHSTMNLCMSWDEHKPLFLLSIFLGVELPEPLLGSAENSKVGTVYVCFHQRLSIMITFYPCQHLVL